MQVTALHNRDLYLNRMIAFQDTEMIKVITGIRRCGKSSLLRLMAAHLRDSGIAEKQIIEMNFESMTIPEMDAQQLYDYIKAKIVPGRRMYLFFDEIQMVQEWERAINAFRVDFDSDIYITGSNAYLLSSDLSTYLSGRYVEIKVLPLSFKEFLDFNGYRVESYTSLSGKMRKRAVNAEGVLESLEDLYGAYIKFGGMPMLTNLGMDIANVSAALDGVYSAAIVNDIMQREQRKGQRMITDALLLRKIVNFLADNIGNNTSANAMSNVLSNEGLVVGGKKAKPAVQTVQAYIEAVKQAYLFYETKRFDIKGKEYLRTLGKYYIVDIGLRNYLLGYREGDTGHILENIVYFELLRRGYDVAVGKIGNLEIDFVATKADEKVYVQVTESMLAPETRQRELTPLLKVTDNYEKIILTLDVIEQQEQDGVKIINALDFLLL